VEQFERYLDYLERVHRRPRSKLRGLLFHRAEDASGAVIDRLQHSDSSWSCRASGTTD
jgi:hypothetical protein